MFGDWIEWKPKGDFDHDTLDGGIWVEVLMVDGEKDQGFVYTFNWGLVDEGGEITAYRVSIIQDAPAEFIEILDDNLDEVLA